MKRIKTAFKVFLKNVLAKSILKMGIKNLTKRLYKPIAVRTSRRIKKRLSYINFNKRMKYNKKASKADIDNIYKIKQPRNKRNSQSPDHYRYSSSK